jgi:hypothetical protein
VGALIAESGTNRLTGAVTPFRCSDFGGEYVPRSFGRDRPPAELLSASAPLRIEGGAA